MSAFERVCAALVCDSDDEKELIREFSALRSNAAKDAESVDHEDTLLAQLCIVRRSWTLGVLELMPSRRLAICFKVASLPSSILNSSFFAKLCATASAAELCFHALATAATVFPFALDALKFFLRTHDIFDALPIASKDALASPSQSLLLRERLFVYSSFKLCRLGCIGRDSLQNWVPFVRLAQRDDVEVSTYALRCLCYILGMKPQWVQDCLSRKALRSDANAGSSELPDSSAIWTDEIEQDELCRCALAPIVETSCGAESDFEDSRPITGQPSTTTPSSGATRCTASTVALHGIEVVRKTVFSDSAHPFQIDDGSNDATFIETETSVQNLKTLALALCQPQPILVEGVSGSGKSLAIRHMAKLLAHTDIIELHLDSQMDSKTLLGSYVCTDTPGEFVWKAGVLTQAMQQGLWVVIEDLPSAPMEILSSIMPLLEKGELTLPGRGLHVVAHPSFRVFGTYTLPETASTDGASELPGPLGDKISNLFSRAVLEPLPAAELLHVVQVMHQRTPPFVAKTMVESFLRLKHGDTASEAGTAGATKHLAARFQRYGRGLSHRELFKWCHRVNTFARFERDEGDDTEFLTRREKVDILSEAFDIFCAPFPWEDTRVEICRVLARTWDLTDEEADAISLHPDPSVVNTSYMTKVTIGRVELDKVDRDDEQPSAANTGDVSLTRHTRCLITQIAACVKMAEPILLVGETGAGKTTIIQHLASLMGQRLVVQNLNVQTDSSDILGGFRPVQMRQLVVPVYDEFMRLFKATEISAQENAKFLKMMQQALVRSKWRTICRGFAMMVQVVRKKIREFNGDDADDNGNADDVHQGKRAKTTASLSPTDAQSTAKPAKRRAKFSIQLTRQWEEFALKVEALDRKRVQVKQSFAFSFVEGALVKALREGHWLLLDEINLAPSAALQRLLGLLDSATASIALTERGDWAPIKRHPNFRLFAAMNPPTDFGKKALLPAMRNRFTELYVTEMTDAEDLALIVGQHLQELPQAKCPTKEIVDFYLQCRKLAGESLVDGQGRAPRFSLRTLSRSLSFARLLMRSNYPLKQAMYEGFCMNFLTQLDGKSRDQLRQRIKQVFAAELKRNQLRYAPPNPTFDAASNSARGSSAATAAASDEERRIAAKAASLTSGDLDQKRFVRVAHFWIEQGPGEVNHGQKDEVDQGGNESFIVTPTVKVYLTDLARAAVARKYPVLLQGPTSSGKTSMVQYLAGLTGHTCVRINNHEHTDLQEYIGSYVTNSRGQLVFSEGPLVQAVRRGHWIILDELNLAPSDVLEALNRLLDDNRELYVPELEEVIKPHPHFMLFATQNPPGLYGGRKVLSQAFRNRFLELNVDDIPGPELVDILVKRVHSLAPPFAECMVNVKTELESIRRGGDIFHGKRGFITPRDLLRWATRNPGTYEELAAAGYSLLAERLRSDAEKLRVKNVLEDLCGRGRTSRSTMPVAIRPTELYNRQRARTILLGEAAKQTDGDLLEEDLKQCVPEAIRGFASTMRSDSPIAITDASARLSVLVHECLQNREPVLLVGATGSGKTTICQLMAKQLGRRLHIVNCHAHTDTADIIGSLRPVRNKQAVKTRLIQLITEYVSLGKALVDAVIDGRQTTEEGARALTERIQTLRSQLQSPSAADSFNDAWPQFETAKQLISLATGDEGKPAPSDRSATKRSGDGTVKIERTTNGESSGYIKEQAPAHSAALRVERERALALEKQIQEQRTRLLSLFEWHDGPLVQAMKNGDMILFDELSLADDAVIERLNSVLENKRSLTISEKGADATGSRKKKPAASGGDNSTEVVVAHPNFLIVATMNPGGDFGKRELSPALRNRFTEIWVPAMESYEDFFTVTLHHLLKLLGPSTTDARRTQLLKFVPKICQFVVWFNNKFGGGGTVAAQTGQGSSQGLMLTVRDALSWLSFVVQTCPQQSDAEVSAVVEEWSTYLHGASMSILDGIGLGTGKSERETIPIRRAVAQYLQEQIPKPVVAELPYLALKILSVQEPARNGTESSRPLLDLQQIGNRFHMGPFSIPCGAVPKITSSHGKYAFGAETTTDNVVRIMRSMQLKRPLLLEGSPGVGKTSVILALARASGHSVTRINLSEQTDIADLLGSDLPAPSPVTTRDASQSSAKEDAFTDRFRWCNGPLLKALINGDWVILDELNLATQTVLEGLNSLLDHRSEVYIPELDQTFKCPPTFRIFACQNPIQEGGGRKGLPKSFMNRFTRVHVAPLTEDDLQFIASALYPSLNGPASTNSQNCLQRLIAFNRELHAAVCTRRELGTRGAPWDFNLRDLFRWFDLIQQQIKLPQDYQSLSQDTPALDGVFDGGAPSSHDQVLALVARKFLPIVYSSRFREPKDYLGVLSVYDRCVTSPSFCLGEASTASLPAEEISSERTIEVDVTPTEFKVGPACLKLSDVNDPNRMNGARSGLRSALMLPAQERLLSNMITSIAQAWPIILVGSSSSGKTNAVELLGSFSCKNIITIPLSSSVDASELLGCFEQSDPEWRTVTKLKKDVLPFLDEVSSLLLHLGLDKAQSGRAELCEAIFALRRDVLAISSPSGTTQSQVPRGRCPVRDTAAVIESIKDVLENIDHHLDAELAVLEAPGDKLRVKATKSLASAAKLAQQQISFDSNRDRAANKSSSATANFAFEWVDSVLLRAIEAGDWVVLENVNHCSPSVLDRLNAFLEPEGELLINECGPVLSWDAASGTYVETPRVVKAHPNFRLFMTMDPRYGSISRAFRNRCIELFVEPRVSDSQNTSPHATLTPCLVSLQRVVGSVGFHNRHALCHAMTKVHVTLSESPSMMSSTTAFLPRHLLRWAEYLHQLVLRGADIVDSVWRSFKFAYCITTSTSIATADASVKLKVDRQWLFSHLQRSFHAFNSSNELLSPKFGLGLFSMGSSTALRPTPQQRAVDFQSTLGPSGAGFPCEFALSGHFAAVHRLWLLKCTALYFSGGVPDTPPSTQKRQVYPLASAVLPYIYQLRKFPKPTAYATATTLEHLIVHLCTATVHPLLRWLDCIQSALFIEKHKAAADSNPAIMHFAQVLDICLSTWTELRLYIVKALAALGMTLSKQPMPSAQLSLRRHSEWENAIAVITASQAHASSLNMFNILRQDIQRVQLCEFLTPTLLRQLTIRIKVLHHGSERTQHTIQALKLQSEVLNTLVLRNRLQMFMGIVGDAARRSTNDAAFDISSQHLTLLQYSYVLYEKLLDKSTVEQLLQHANLDTPSNNWIKSLRNVMPVVALVVPFIFFVINDVFNSVCEMILLALDSFGQGHQAMYSKFVEALNLSLSQLLQFATFAHEMAANTAEVDSSSFKIVLGLHWLRASSSLYQCSELAEKMSTIMSNNRADATLARISSIAAALRYRIGRLNSAMLSIEQTFSMGATITHIASQGELWVFNGACAHLSANNSLEVNRQSATRICTEVRSFIELSGDGVRRTQNNEQRMTFDSLAATASPLLAPNFENLREAVSNSLTAWTVQNLCTQLSPELLPLLQAASHDVSALTNAAQDFKQKADVAVLDHVVKMMNVLKISEDQAESMEFDMHSDPHLSTQHAMDQSFVEAVRSKIWSLRQAAPEVGVAFAKTMGKSDVTSIGNKPDAKERGSVVLLRSPDFSVASKWADLQLSPYFILESIVEERALLELIIDLSTSSDTHSEVSQLQQAEEAYQACLRLIHLLEVVPSRPISHLATYKSLAWYLQLFSSKETAQAHHSKPELASQKKILKVLARDILRHSYSTQWSHIISQVATGQGGTSFSSVFVTGPASGQRQRHQDRQTGSSVFDIGAPNDTASIVAGPDLFVRNAHIRSKHIASLLGSAASEFSLGSIQRLLKRINTRNSNFDFAYMGPVDCPHILAVSDVQPKLVQIRKLVQYIASYSETPDPANLHATRLPWLLFVESVEEALVLVQSIAAVKHIELAADHPFAESSTAIKDTLSHLRVGFDQPSQLVEAESVIIAVFDDAIRWLAHSLDDQRAFDVDSSGTEAVLEGNSVQFTPLVRMLKRIVQDGIGLCSKLIRSSSEHKPRIGHLWVLIGCLRLLVSLPNSLGDPLTCKVAERGRLEFDAQSTLHRLSIYPSQRATAANTNDIPDEYQQYFSFSANDYSVTGLKEKYRQTLELKRVVEANIPTRSVSRNAGSSLKAADQPGDVYDQVCGHLSSFLTSMSPLQDILGLSSSFLSTDTSASDRKAHSDRELRFQQLSQQLIDVLATSGVRHENEMSPAQGGTSSGTDINVDDIVTPIITALYHIKHGLHLQRHYFDCADDIESDVTVAFPRLREVRDVESLPDSAKADHRKDDQSLSELLAALAHIRLNLFNSLQWRQSQVSADPQGDDATSVADKKRVRLARPLRQHQRTSTGSGVGSVAAQFQNASHLYFEKLVSHWSAQVEAERQKAWEAGRSFNVRKNRHASSGEIEDDEEIREENFKKMFPNYHMEFADIVASEDTLQTPENIALLGTRDDLPESTSTETADVVTQSTHADHVTADKVDAACKLHLDIFGTVLPERSNQPANSKSKVVVEIEMPKCRPHDGHRY